MKLSLIKLGGSLITDKARPFTVREKTLQRLSQEIADASKEHEHQIILGHGGGSYPHHPAQRYQTHQGFIAPDSRYGFAQVQDAAARLNRIVIKRLLAAGLNAVSLAPSAVCLARSDRIIECYTKTLEEMLKAKMLPVLYGDVGIDLDKGCCVLSTEEILFYLARKLDAGRVIMAGKTDGVFKADPGCISGASKIPIIDQSNFASIEPCLKESDGIDVTGGMRLKVSAALAASRHGIQSQIIDGTQPGNLKKAILGDLQLGTRVQ
jgi:isopentenyl phosphate kinase